MSVTEPIEVSESSRKPVRHRFTVKLRHLTVKRVNRLSRSIIRITLTGPELEGFASLGFDDHVKMFFPAAGETKPRLPSVGPDGLEMPKDPPAPIGRDYTPRRYDPASGELDIDFAISHEGPASNWARNVVEGDSAWIAGPRGSFVFQTDFDWHLLIADETALPALARRLEELPAKTKVVAVIEVDGAEDQLDLHSNADAEIRWIHRNPDSSDPAAAFMDAVRSLAGLQGDFLTWIACESSIAKRLRHFVIEELGANKKWVRASGYWRQGTSGAHDKFE